MWRVMRTEQKSHQLCNIKTLVAVLCDLPAALNFDQATNPFYAVSINDIHLI